jgi:hypothetical protein
MAKRRKYIPLRERYAAALACLLPQELRDLYRHKHVAASVIISQFEIDHIVLHAFDGSDAWWNLDPKLKPAHREKSRRDTSIAAKALRIDHRWKEFTAAMAKGHKPPQRPSRWPKRKLLGGKPHA